jgi:hypothetical protein
VRRAVPAGERIRSSWSSGIVFASFRDGLPYRLVSGEISTVIF